MWRSRQYDQIHVPIYFLNKQNTFWFISESTVAETSMDVHIPMGLTFHGLNFNTSPIYGNWLNSKSPLRVRAHKYSLSAMQTLTLIFLTMPWRNAWPVLDCECLLPMRIICSMAIRTAVREWRLTLQWWWDDELYTVGVVTYHNSQWMF